MVRVYTVFDLNDYFEYDSRKEIHTIYASLEEALRGTSPNALIIYYWMDEMTGHIDTSMFFMAT